MFNLIFQIMILVLIQTESKSFFSHLLQIINHGGKLFMVPILIMLLLTFFLVIKSVIETRKDHSGLSKKISLINSIGLLALVYGVLGQLVGLVMAFDKIEMLGEISTPMLAGGLKISALPTIFGFVVFVVSRISTIIFTWVQKEGDVNE